jgi:hypothetical protein
MYIMSMQVKTVCPPSIVVMQVVKRKKKKWSCHEKDLVRSDASLNATRDFDRKEIRKYENWP